MGTNKTRHRSSFLFPILSTTATALLPDTVASVTRFNPTHVS